MPPRRRCPVCGSKKWHKEPSSGLVACSEGHVLQNYRNETTETTELGPHALRKRTLKSQRSRARRSAVDPQLHHGDRARFHHFQCLQLLLRKQIVALTRIWDLPREFEIVCRDLWALHLSVLAVPPPPEPLLHAQGQRGDPAPAPAVPARAEKTQPESTSERPPKREGGEEDGPATSSSESDSASASSSEDEKDDKAGSEPDPETMALMRELSGSDSDDGSSSEDGDGAGNEEGAPKAGATRRRRRGRADDDAPASTLAVLVLACWTLRLPVVYVDVIRLIEKYDLPYLDPLRRGLLPPSLAKHLTKHSAQALSPFHAPTPDALHTRTARLAKRLRAAHGVHTPELNAAPVLWRAVRALGGTPPLYALTKTLARALALPLTLHPALAPALPRVRARDPERHLADGAPPEVVLVAAAVVVLKMVYGLDGVERVPVEDADPACALPRLEEWLAVVQQLESEGVQSSEAQFSARSQMSVLDMDDEQLDAYLDLSEKALLPANDINTGRHTLDQYFPRTRGAARAAEDASPPMTRTESAPHPPIRTGANALQPGQAQRVFHAGDVGGALPAAYAAVLGRGARWAGVDAARVGGVVERFERRAARWGRRGGQDGAEGAADVAIGREAGRIGTRARGPGEASAE